MLKENWIFWGLKKKKILDIVPKYFSHKNIFSVESVIELKNPNIHLEFFF